MLLNVLIIDKDLTSQYHIETIIKEEGHQLYFFNSYSYVLDLMQAVSFDLILCSMDTVEEHSLEQVAKYRQLNPDAKIVLITNKRELYRGLALFNAIMGLNFKVDNFKDITSTYFDKAYVSESLSLPVCNLEYLMLDWEDEPELEVKEFIDELIDLMQKNKSDIIKHHSALISKKTDKNKEALLGSILRASSIFYPMVSYKTHHFLNLFKRHLTSGNHAEIIMLPMKELDAAYSDLIAVLQKKSESIPMLEFY